MAVVKVLVAGSFVEGVVVVVEVAEVMVVSVVVSGAVVPVALAVVVFVMVVVFPRSSSTTAFISLP